MGTCVAAAGPPGNPRTLVSAVSAARLRDDRMAAVELGGVRTFVTVPLTLSNRTAIPLSIWEFLESQPLSRLLFQARAGFIRTHSS